MDEQEQWARQDQLPAMPQQVLRNSEMTDAVGSSPIEQRQDDWYSVALQQSAQLSDLAKAEQAEHEQWVEQAQQSARGYRASQEKLRNKATAANKKPQKENWFNMALQQSAQLNDKPEMRTVV